MINLPLFGIDVIQDDGDFVWLRGPSGRMRVSKKAPRVYFESVSDAHQAGAVAIRIGSFADEQSLKELIEEAQAEGQNDPDEGEASGEAEA